MPEVDSTGTQNQTIAEKIYGLIEDANVVRSPLEAQWTQDIRLYENDHWNTLPPDNIVHVTMPLIKRAVDAQAAALYGNRPRIDMSPRETDGSALYFIPPQIGAQLLSRFAAAGVQTPMGFTDLQLGGVDPLMEMQAQALNQFVPMDDLIRLDDYVVSDLLRRIVGTMWDRHDWDTVWASAGTNTLTLGTQPMLFEWDNTRHEPILSQLHNKAVWIDPMMQNGDINTARYAIVAQQLDAGYAASLYPDQKGTILAESTSGCDQYSLGSATLPAHFQDAGSYRKNVLIINAWLRDSKPKEYRLPNGNTGVSDIRNVKLLVTGNVGLGKTLLDQPSPYNGIPILWPINHSMPYSPYGMSEPFLLEDLNKGINRLVTAMVNHTRFFAYPQQIIPASVKRGLKDYAFRSLHSYPGRMLTMPDNLFEKFGANAANMFAVPPSLNSSYMDFLNILISQFHEISNQGDVSRGIATSKATSGRAIAELQQAAGKVSGLRSVWIERSMARLTRLAVSASVDFMPNDKWARFSDKYTPQMQQLIKTRARAMDYDVQLELAVGKGQHREVEQQKAYLMRGNGDLSRKTYLEKMGLVDPEVEERRIMAEQVQQMQMQMAMMPPEDNSQKPKQPSNGEKQSAEAQAVQ